MTFIDIPANQQLLMAEDIALKDLVTGIQLDAPRERSGKIEVGVWFRWPQREYSDNLFPFITLDLLDVRLELNRAHSYNYDSMSYVSDTLPDNEATPDQYIAPYPVPYTLVYLVATHCRSAQHDRHIYNRLLQWDLLPRRFGQILVPMDMTVRRLDVFDISENNEYDSLKKRVFRRMFTIGISAEMLPEDAAIYAQRVQEVIFDPIEPPIEGLTYPFD